MNIFLVFMMLKIVANKEMVVYEKIVSFACLELIVDFLNAHIISLEIIDLKPCLTLLILEK